jgi:protein-ribulosamine 3-kinase
MVAWGIVASAIHDATHRPFEVRGAAPVGGGSINEAYRLEGTDGTRYFIKLNEARHLDMFVAEAAGLEAIAATKSVRVPRPIVHGSDGRQSYLVLEHLELSSRGDAKQLGEQLAALHRNTSSPLPYITSDLAGVVSQPCWRRCRIDPRCRF